MNFRKKDWDETNGPPDYIFRTDDDVYVNIASLHDLLFRWPSGMNTYRLVQYQGIWGNS